MPRSFHLLGAFMLGWVLSVNATCGTTGDGTANSVKQALETIESYPFVGALVRGIIGNVVDDTIFWSSDASECIRFTLCPWQFCRP